MVLIPYLLKNLSQKGIIFLGYTVRILLSDILNPGNLNRTKKSARQLLPMTVYQNS